MLNKLLNSIPADLARQINDRVNALVKENDIMRAMIAKSDMDCIYCGLPKKDLAKCVLGFPGCGRADDELNDPRDTTGKYDDGRV